MQLVNNMYQSAQSYCQAIPRNTGRAMLYSAGIGFIIETILTSNPSRGITLAARSALASAIHGFVTPIFKEIIGTRQQLTLTEEIGRTSVALIGTGCIAAAFDYSLVLESLLPLTIIHTAMNYLNPSRCNIQSANIMVI